MYKNMITYSNVLLAILLSCLQPQSIIQVFFSCTAQHIHHRPTLTLPSQHRPSTTRPSSAIRLVSLICLMRFFEGCHIRLLSVFLSLSFARFFDEPFFRALLSQLATRESSWFSATCTPCPAFHLSSYSCTPSMPF
jgi:hypothetical protein